MTSCSRCRRLATNVGIGVTLMVLALACGKNLYTSAVSKTSSNAKYEQVRVLLDEKRYADASGVLAGINDDTNEKRILQVAALLGNAGLVLGDIVISITEQTLSTSVKSGIDNIFNMISTAVIGAGATKTQRIGAIEQAMSTLDGAPAASSDNVKNLGCFLAGVLTLPTIDDGLAALTDVQTALSEVQTKAIGNGATTAQCPGLDKLNTSLAAVSQIQQQFALVLSHIQNCSFMNISQTANNLNQVEQKIVAIIKNADKGCTTSPSCTGKIFCGALALGCVKDLMIAGAATAVAGDGVISSCEILQNCLADPTKCFAIK